MNFPPTQVIEEFPALMDETLVSMKDACNKFPVKVSRSGVESLIRKGTRGIKLETIFISNKRYTSEEAIRRFIERTQNRPDQKKEIHQPVRSRLTAKELEEGRKKYKFPVPEGVQ